MSRESLKCRHDAMQDLILGFLLLALATLLFMSAVLEWGTWIVVLLGIAFVGNVLVWLVICRSGVSLRHKTPFSDLRSLRNPVAPVESEGGIGYLRR